MKNLVILPILLLFGVENMAMEHSKHKLEGLKEVSGCELTTLEILETLQNKLIVAQCNADITDQERNLICELYAGNKNDLATKYILKFNTCPSCNKQIKSYYIKDGKYHEHKSNTCRHLNQCIFAKKDPVEYPKKKSKKQKLNLEADINTANPVLPKHQTKDEEMGNTVSTRSHHSNRKKEVENYTIEIQQLIRNIQHNIERLQPESDLDLAKVLKGKQDLRELAILAGIQESGSINTESEITLPSLEFDSDIEINRNYDLQIEEDLNDNNKAGSTLTDSKRDHKACAQSLMDLFNSL